MILLKQMNSVSAGCLPPDLLGRKMGKFQTPRSSCNDTEVLPMRAPARLLARKALSCTSVEGDKDDTADTHIQASRDMHASAEPLSDLDGQRLRLTSCIWFAGPSSWLVDRHDTGTVSEDH